MVRQRICSASWGRFTSSFVVPEPSQFRYGDSRCRCTVQSRPNRVCMIPVGRWLVRPRTLPALPREEWKRPFSMGSASGWRKVLGQKQISVLWDPSTRHLPDESRAGADHARAQKSGNGGPVRRAAPIHSKHRYPRQAAHCLIHLARSPYITRFCTAFLPPFIHNTTPHPQHITGQFRAQSLLSSYRLLDTHKEPPLCCYCCNLSA